MKAVKLDNTQGDSPESEEARRTRYIGDLQKVIRQASADRLSDQAGGAQVTIDNSINPRTSILGHWLTVIIISGGKLKISFKCHFMTEAGSIHLARKTNRTPDDVEPSMVFDLLKEYCNLVGGSVKSSLGRENSRMGLSLPLLTRGFDEVLFADRVRRAGKRRHRDVWTLQLPYAKFVCSSEIQVVNWTNLEDLGTDKTQKSLEGEVDFL